MESSASAGRVAPAVLEPRRWWALALLCGALFMVLLDGTITIVAPPSIGVTAAWLIGGPLVDRPGWRWIFIINVPIGLAAPGKAGFRRAAATGLALGSPRA